VTPNIPDDLKDLHQDAITDKAPSNGWRQISRTLIYRIALLEAKIERLGADVTEAEFDEYFHLANSPARDMATVDEINKMIEMRGKAQ
jgi:hypothetical protein